MGEMADDLTDAGLAAKALHDAGRCGELGPCPYCCDECGGDGECLHCDGLGVVGDTPGGRSCLLCQGTGRCPYCADAG